MRLITSFVALSAILAVASCSAPEPRTIVRTEYVQQNIQIQPKPRSVTMRDVNFYVVTEENYEEFKTRFVRENGEFVFVAVSIDGYENLSLNLADLQRYINQQNQVIVFYEKSVK